ncbi:MAG: NUDIX domain-containing protein [Chloroflexi bacterium]|nr:NUDIX domain-containing protein [Chloroflexota bacterium]
MLPIRNSAKAIIIADGQLLVVKHADAAGDWYLLPGGGQHHGETLVDAVRRECFEELGIEVQVGRLLYIREYIGAHHEFAGEDGESHQVEFMFTCQIPGGVSVTGGAEPDHGQIGVAWISLSSLPKYRLYPLAMRELLARHLGGEHQVYLGDIN